MIDAVCCARKLTLALGVFQKKSSHAKGWLAPRVIESSASILGINYTCEIFAFDFSDIEHAPVDGILMSYVKIGENGKVTVFVNKISNHCWQRFYICKEIIHVAASNSENVTLGYDKISSVLENIQARNFGVDKATKIEFDAEFGAIELMMPKEMVDSLDESVGFDFTQYTDGKIEQIARDYKIPKLIVKARLTSEQFRNIFKQAYDSHGYKNAAFSAIMP